MKTFKQLRESIIDIPRSVYAPLVFDDADTSNPKIKQSVLDMIENQIKDESGGELDPMGQDDGMFAQNNPEQGDK